MAIRPLPITLRGLMLGAGVAIIAAIWALSLMPAPPQIPGGDKWHHFAAYAGCTAWWCMTLTTWRQRRIAMATLVVMGAAIEILQGLSGFRHFELADIAANTLGVLSGGALINLLPVPAESDVRS